MRPLYAAALRRANRNQRDCSLLLYILSRSLYSLRVCDNRPRPYDDDDDAAAASVDGGMDEGLEGGYFLKKKKKRQ